MATIGHNQKAKAKRIFDSAVSIRSYTLDNGFIGRDCNRLDYKGEPWMFRDWERFKARLTEDRPTHFHLTFHSNDWVEFQTEN